MKANLEKLIVKLVSNTSKRNGSGYKVNKSRYNELIRSSRALDKIISRWSLDFDADIDTIKMNVDVIIYFEIMDEDVHENGFLDIFKNCTRIDIEDTKSNGIYTMKLTYSGIWDEVCDE